MRAVSVRGRTEDSDSVLFIIHDVSDIRRRQMREREFVGNVSHELRTPITAILTTAETLLAGAKNDPDVVDRFLGTIISESKRLSALIEDILEITKRDYGITKNNVAESAVSDVVNRAIDLVRPQAKNAGVEIIADLPDGLRVSWDDTQVVRLIGNLVDNAVKYSPGGGRVDVNSYEEGSMLVISVADKGMGIPHGEIDRIFDRFYRIDKAHSRRIGGTGLGLAIVKDIVNACDGSIAVETQLGVGTTFTVKLPMRGTLQEDSEECMADNPDCQA